MADTVIAVYDAGPYYLSVAGESEDQDGWRALCAVMDRLPVHERERLGAMHAEMPGLLGDWLEDQGMDRLLMRMMRIRRRLPFQVGKPPLGKRPQVRAGTLAYAHPFFAKWFVPLSDWGGAFKSISTGPDHPGL